MLRGKARREQRAERMADKRDAGKTEAVKKGRQRLRIVARRRRPVGERRGIDIAGRIPGDDVDLRRQGRHQRGEAARIAADAVKKDQRLRCAGRGAAQITDARDPLAAQRGAVGRPGHDRGAAPGMSTARGR